MEKNPQVTFLFQTFITDIRLATEQSRVEKLVEVQTMYSARILVVFRERKRKKKHFIKTKRLIITLRSNNLILSD